MFILLSLLALFPARASAISESNGSVCVITDMKKLYCYSENREAGLRSLPYYPHTVHDISLGTTGYGCFTSHEGLHCWGGETPSFSSDLYKVEVYGDNACAGNDSSMVCWGKTAAELGLDKIPEFRRMSSFILGPGFACATAREEGTKCWGKNAPPVPAQVAAKSSHRIGFRQNQICVRHMDIPLEESCWEWRAGATPKNTSWLNSLVGVEGVTNRNRVCALHAEGVDCEGERVMVRGVQPKTPSRMSMAEGNLCVVDEGVERCWGNEKTRAVALGQLRNPVTQEKAELTGGHACEIRSGYLHCVTGKGSPEEKDANPRTYNERDDEFTSVVAVADSYFCGIQSQHVICWLPSGTEDNPRFVYSAVANARFLVADEKGGACAYSGAGLRCWGNTFVLPTPFARDLGNWLKFWKENLAVTPLYRAGVMKEIIAGVEESFFALGPKELELALEMAESMSQHTAAGVDSERGPILHFHNRSSDFSLTRTPGDFAEPSEVHYKFILRVLKASLHTAEQLIGPRAEFGEAKRAIGMALADSENAQKRKAVEEAVNALAPKLESLQKARKGDYLPLLVERLVDRL